MNSMKDWIRRAFVACLGIHLACLPAVRERCQMLTDPVASPALPVDLGALDALLMTRAREMTAAARGLDRSIVWAFRLAFADELLPLLWSGWSRPAR